MKRIHLLNLSKLVMGSLTMIVFLTACGGGGSSSDTPENADNGEIASNNNGQKCKVTNISMMPNSGELTRSSSLTAIVDYEVYDSSLSPLNNTPSVFGLFCKAGVGCGGKSFSIETKHLQKKAGQRAGLHEI